MVSLIFCHPGSVAKEEAEGVELKRESILYLVGYKTTTNPGLLNPQASKSENMRADKSFFMVFNCVLSLLTHALLTSVGEMKLRIFWL